VSRVARRAAPLYFGLLLLLSAVGLVNQGLYHHQMTLIEQRQKLLDSVANLRLRAAGVNGPLAVTQWADAHGMVPAPEASNVGAVAPGVAPQPTLPTSGLEIRTVWH
jgi:hypothetical protein